MVETISKYGLRVIEVPGPAPLEEVLDGAFLNELARLIAQDLLRLLDEGELVVENGQICAKMEDEGD